MKIRSFRQKDTEEIIALWDACGLLRPWNDPKQDIQRKMELQPELFLVGLSDNRVIADESA
tara:strand:- start:2562 stop:2744 length:183 start_codon:yes stop_codon:yes gene_type:complete